MLERRLRIGLLSPWASRLGGGVFEAVVAQAKMIEDMGADPVVFALLDQHSHEDRRRFGNAEVHLGQVLGPAQIGFSPRLARLIAASNIDLLHLHGIWTMTSHLAERWASTTGRPYIISPHGMLDPWITARGRVKKWLARTGYERRNWARATLFHALTQAEADDINRESGRDSVTVIPNAVTPWTVATSNAERSGIVYLGRIHPKKNIDALIAAWQVIAAKLGTGAPRLTIAGWGEEDHVAALVQRIQSIADDRLSFAGPVFGDNKRRLIEGAEMIALPSHSEGLPMVILEAWAAGVPTVMSRHCHLPEGFDVGAAIDSGTDVAAIAAALSTLLNENAAERCLRRDAALSLVDRRFSSSVVQAMWARTYRTLLRDSGLKMDGKRGLAA